MIVRIATEGQYELTESDAEVLNELDNQAVAACEGADEEQFHAAFKELIEFVRANG
ncbi:MAG: PspA-associated protein PspAA, partial [Solirubrobacteraceae bacterium]